MTKKRIFTWLAALVLFVSAMISFVALPKKNVASAAEAQVPKDLYYFRVIDHGDPQEEEDRIASLCQMFKNAEFIKNYYVKVVDCNDVFLLVTDDALFENFIDLSTAYGEALIYDTAGIELKRDNINQLMPAFSALKEKAFRIMFISETDEMFFHTDEGLLKKCVNIHINKDIYTQFLVNLFNKVYGYFGGSFEWHDITFLLSMSVYETGFIETRLLSLLETALSSILSERQCSVQEYCAENNIKVLVYLNDTTYMDGFTNQMKYADQFDTAIEQLGTYFATDKLVAIGANWAPSDCDDPRDISDDEWLNMLKTMQERTTLSDLVIFQYEHFDKYVRDISPYTTSGPTDVRFLLVEFLTCDYPEWDLVQYNNWSGDCAITHKATTFGPDGWMEDFGFSDPDSSSSAGEKEYVDVVTEAWAR